MPNNTIQTGESRQLNITQQGNQRFFVGLSWDASNNKNLLDRFKELISGKSVFHDLDLTCFLYDKNKKIIDVISGKNGEIVDKSGSIYHSGDDKDGMGAGDDEQVSVELANIPSNVQHIVFKASISSNHKFSEVEAPEIRLVDAYSKRSINKTALNVSNSEKSTGYVFAEIYRGLSEDDNPTWHFHYINKFTSWKDNSVAQKKIPELLNN